MSFSPAPSSAIDAALGELEGRRRKHPRHAFTAWLEAHPARSLACSDRAFVAELSAQSLYCRASRSSVQRWEVMFRCRAPSQAHAQQWHVYGMDVGLKQRSTLLARAAFCELLVLRMMHFGGVCGVKYPLRHAACVVSRRHFLSKDLAYSLFQEGQRLYEQHIFSDAVKSWAQAALLQHAASHAFLSNMLIHGFQSDRRPYFAEDVKRAFELAAAGTAMGCAHSKGMLGLCLVDGAGVAKDVGNGLALARESAAAGSRFGQHTVGWCYHRGMGVAQDCREARRWYRLEEAQGHAEAQYKLGTLFHNRDVPSRNADKKAARWFSLAAAQGHARSQYAFAECLEDGDGVAQDFAEAVRWYRLLAAQGDDYAQFRVGRLFREGHSHGNAKDTEEAKQWYSNGAAQGYHMMCGGKPPRRSYPAKRAYSAWENYSSDSSESSSLSGESELSSSESSF